MVAALAAVHIIRSYAGLMEARVSELETFAGRVAHDMRAPLSAIGLTLDLVRRTQPIAPELRGMVDRGGKTVRRMGDLIEGLLVFALAGAQPSPRETADARTIVGEVVDGLKPSAEEMKIHLEIARVDPCKVACSPGVLTSIVSNLLGNAIKYMGDASLRLVTTTVRRVGSRGRIEVTDTGPGISPEVQETLFQPFVRGAHQEVPGVGLGLATVRRLAEAHRGAVGSKSRQGGGALFWVELPIVDDASSTRKLDATQAGPPSTA
jgi:signal transduction histidine kinase